jgi:hypothetical protein
VVSHKNTRPSWLSGSVQKTRCRSTTDREFLRCVTRPGRPQRKSV